MEVGETKDRVSEHVITIAQREDKEQDSNRILFEDTDLREAVIWDLWKS